MNTEVQKNKIVLDDDLDAAFGIGHDAPFQKSNLDTEQRAKVFTDPNYGFKPGSASLEHAAVWTESCTKCGGTGRWKGIRQCFSCEGKGTKTFATSPAQRAASRAASENRKRKMENIAREEANAWATENPDEYAWLLSNSQSGNNFASSLLTNLQKYGALTENQITAIRKSIAKNAERQEAYETAKANAPTVSIEKIETAFQTAVNNKIQRPKLNLGNFKFSLAPAHGKNAGAIYVKQGDTYLGKIQDARFIAQFGVSEEVKREVADVCSNPYEAAKAYGKRIGSCACCGRTLTNGESIDLGIGPICAETYGWA